MVLLAPAKPGNTAVLETDEVLVPDVPSGGTPVTLVVVLPLAVAKPGNAVEVLGEEVEVPTIPSELAVVVEAAVELFRVEALAAPELEELGPVPAALEAALPFPREEPGEVT